MNEEEKRELLENDAAFFGDCDGDLAEIVRIVDFQEKQKRAEEELLSKEIAEEAHRLYEKGEK